MSELLKRTDRLWSGDASTTQAEFHPFAGPRLLEELAPGIAFFKAFVNVTAVKTGEGLVLVDTGSYHPASHKLSFDAVRRWNGERVHTAVYTHGHVDHAYGLPPFLAEARGRGWQAPRIVGHDNVLPRMQRYVRTAGYNSIINTRQFGVATQWPVDFQAPTQTYADALEFSVGGARFQLHHAKGETDDHTWVFLPETKTLCTGDLFIWAAPNAGNPQKVQRYAVEWAAALRAMAEVFELRPHFEWRGLGWIAHSALKLRPELADWDAEARFELPGTRIEDPKACQCGEVLIGAIKPWECKVFGTACTPERPIGTCMVSSEGACAAYYNYGRLQRRRDRVPA